MNKLIVIGSIVLIAIGGYFFLFFGNPASQEKSVSPENETTLSAEEVEQPTGEDTTVREFVVSGSNFQFSKNELRVNKGDTVRITFVNGGGVHNFVIDAFAASTSVLQMGEEETIEFVADRAGTFQYYCSVGNHRDLGMVGELIVE
tara:strand:- start:1436 stop:1873 length:438 start_codon:yes stop_codon:yes gene_type:complete